MQNIASIFIQFTQYLINIILTIYSNTVVNLWEPPRNKGKTHKKKGLDVLLWVATVMTAPLTATGR